MPKSYTVGVGLEPIQTPISSQTKFLQVCGPSHRNSKIDSNISHYEQNCTFSVRMQLLEDMNVEYKRSISEQVIHCTSASGQRMQEKWGSHWIHDISGYVNAYFHQNYYFRHKI